jgi:hypothetical protein
MCRAVPRFTRAVVPLFVFAFLSACFEIKQDIVVDRNLAGSADLQINIDFEPMVMIMGHLERERLVREMEGKERLVTEEEVAKELAKFRGEFMKELQREQSAPIDLAEVNAEMPEGVKVVAANLTVNELKMTTRFNFNFGSLSLLTDLKLPSKPRANPTHNNVLESPFQGLEVIEKGDIITIRSRPRSPADDVEKWAEADVGWPNDPETKKMMKDAFKTLGFTFRITAPFEIVSHNAQRKEGKTLVWVYDLERFEKMTTTEADDLGIHVTYRR